MPEAVQQPDPNVKWSGTIRLDMNNPQVPVRIRQDNGSVYLEWQPKGAWEWAKADSLTPHALQMLLHRLTLTVLEQADQHQASENKHLDDHLALNSESRSRGVLISNIEEKVNAAGVPSMVPGPNGGETNFLENRVGWLGIQYEKLTTELELKRGLVAYVEGVLNELAILPSASFRARVDALKLQAQKVGWTETDFRGWVEKLNGILPPSQQRDLPLLPIEALGKYVASLKERILELEGDPTAPIAHWRGLANSLQGEADEVKAFLTEYRAPERVEDLQEHEKDQHTHPDGVFTTKERLELLMGRWRFNLAYYSGVMEVLTAATGGVGTGKTMKERAEQLVKDRDAAREDAEKTLSAATGVRQQIVGQLIAAGLPSKALENRPLPEAVALYLKHAPLCLATQEFSVHSLADLKSGKNRLTLKGPEGFTLNLTGLATNPRSRGLLTYLFTCTRLALVVLEEGPLSEKHRAR